jgi:hypothetical protein
VVTEESTVLGHLALHYGEGDELPARRLLELLGCTLVDNGPAPGSDGFCTVLVDPATADYADNLMFLSGLTAEQEAVEATIRSALRLGEPDADPAAGKFVEASTVKPESSSHIGFRYRSLPALEKVLADLEAAALPGGELAGRIQVTKYRARPGGDEQADASVAAQIDASAAFTGDEPPSFAPHWIQCFVRTDLCGFGILAFGSTFELDYVFAPFMDQPPSFGRRPAGTNPGLQGR